MSGSRDNRRLAPHTPVLYQQVLSTLSPCAGGLYIDGTVGAGGHARGILEVSSPDGALLGLDRDPAALAIARETLAPYGDRATLRQGNYAYMLQFARALGWEAVDGVLLDLGLSSMQLADPDRGFSFQLDGPLDMRFDPDQGSTAADLVNHLSSHELGRILRRYGEVPNAGRVARAIIESRPIRSTRDLAEIVARLRPRKDRKIHPATRVFQALRMALNGELEALDSGLEQALQLLKPGGRLVVIAFHSLEDRPVKHFFRQESKDCICPSDQPVCTCGHSARLKLLTKRALRPDQGEIRRNPRARSARLRAAEKLAADRGKR